MRKLPFLPSFHAFAVACIATAFLPHRLPADPVITVKKIAPGIVLTQEVDQSPALIINVLSVDLKADGVHLGVGIGKDFIDGPGGGREEVTHAARRHGAIAAINADFFPYTGDPLGFGVRDGEMYSEPWTGNGKPGPRTAFGVLPDGTVFIDKVSFLGDLQSADGQRHTITGIDRPVSSNDTIVFTTTFGPVTAGNLSGAQVVVTGVNLPVRPNKTMTGTVQQVITATGQPVAIPADGVVIAAPLGEASSFLTSHLHAGDKLGFVMGVAPPGREAKAVQMAALPRETGDLPSRSGMLVDRSAYLWADAQQAVAGGPRLLVNGSVNIDGVAEGFGPEFTDADFPRTAAGISADGKTLIIVTVDGRQTLSHGVTLRQLAVILQAHGASQAINFDGGGSTALSVAGVQVNSPGGDGYERPVADMLFVYSDHPYVEMAPAVKDAVPATMPAPVAPSAPAVPGQGTIVITPDAPDPEASQQGDPISVHVDKGGDIKISNQQPASTAGPHIVGPLTSIQVGKTTILHVVDGNGTQLPSDSSDVIWQGKVSSGIGFVNQRGQVTGMTAGSGTATALYHGELMTWPVQVVASGTTDDTPKLSAQLMADPGGNPLLSQLVVRVETPSTAPVAGVTVNISCVGGTSKDASVVTKQDGYVTTAITWAAPTGGSVSVASGTLQSVTVNRN